MTRICACSPFSSLLSWLWCDQFRRHRKLLAMWPGGAFDLQAWGSVYSFNGSGSNFPTAVGRLYAPPYNFFSGFLSNLLSFSPKPSVFIFAPAVIHPPPPPPVLFMSDPDIFSLTFFRILSRPCFELQGFTYSTKPKEQSSWRNHFISVFKLWLYFSMGNLIAMY